MIRAEDEGVCGTTSGQKLVHAKLEAAIDAACNVFRACVEPAIWTNLVVALLLLKKIGDDTRASRHRLAAEYAQHPELLQELLRCERFTVPPAAEFETLYEKRLAPGNAARIDRALHALAAANPTLLHGLFNEVRFELMPARDEVERDRTLRHLLEELSWPDRNLRVGISDAAGAGDACERLFAIAAAAGGRQRGDLHTPGEVARLVARIVEPRPGEAICDPLCGNGSLLVACARRVRERHSGGHLALLGQELMGRTWEVARMNLLLNEFHNHRIAWGDTLACPKLLDGEGGLCTFDAVVSHLPFSTCGWDASRALHDPHRRFARGVPPRSKVDYAFILHMMSTLRPDSGRLVVIVPHGVLFRGAAEGAIRHALVTENLLDAVVGLPPKLFHGRSMPAALLVFRKKKPDDEVFFVDASRDFQKGRSLNRLRPEDVDRIVGSLQARRDVDGYARRVGRAEIAANDGNLHIPRYLAGPAPEDDADLRDVVAEQDRLKAEWMRLEEAVNSRIRSLDHD